MYSSNVVDQDMELRSVYSIYFLGPAWPVIKRKSSCSLDPACILVKHNSSSKDVVQDMVAG